MLIRTAARTILTILLGLGLTPLAGAQLNSSASNSSSEVAAPPTVYVADFVSTAATGAAMNNTGDVASTSYLDTGCGSFCLPPLDTVVWRGAVRIVLPPVPGLPGIYVRSINAQGWVAGFAGFPGTTTHAVGWKPNGNVSFASCRSGWQGREAVQLSLRYAPAESSWITTRKA